MTPRGRFPRPSMRSRASAAAGGAVVLVSNAAELGYGLTLTLAARGITDVSDGLVSAGDVTRAVLRERRPNSILYIGSERDRRVIDGVSAGHGGAGAELIVCTGYPEDDADLDDILGEAHRRGVPMLCTNRIRAWSPAGACCASPAWWRSGTASSAAS